VHGRQFRRPGRGSRSDDSIRRLTKRTVSGHKLVWEQVGGKPPLLNMDQIWCWPVRTGEMCA
jgi:hypothetical protein